MKHRIVTRAAALCLALLVVLGAPAARAEHFAVRGRDRGPLKKLTGDVEIILVFVSTPQHPWTQKQKDAVYRVSWSSVDYIHREARRWGADVNVVFGGLEFSVPYEFSSDLKWYRWIMENVYGRSSIVDLYRTYERDLGKDSTPIIFLFNSWDISHTYASSSPEGIGWQEEFCVIFCDTDMHDHYLTHELYHLYGAIDLYDYRSEGIDALTQKYFPGSDMACRSWKVDDLTAYLIGWTDAPTDKAQRFLREIDGRR